MKLWFIPLLLSSVMAHGDMLDENKQDYIAEACYEEACIVYEEQHSGVAVIATSITVEPSSEGFQIKMYVIYSDGTTRDIWSHIAHEFNKKLSLEKIETIVLKDADERTGS